MIRALIVDDSEIAAHFLRRVIESSDEIRVLARFEDADSVWNSEAFASAHIILMDLLMPGASGLSAIRKAASRCPVVVVSDAETDSALAREAVAQGAVAFISKAQLAEPRGQEHLRRTLREATAGRGQTTYPSVVALLGSTGAPNVLTRIVPSLSRSDAAIVVIQHMPEGNEQRFASWLTSLGVPARPARQGEPLATGHALVAPTHAHMSLEPPGVVRLKPPQPGDVHVPSCDAFLKSAAFLDHSLVAVVLSGMGRDGAEGMGGVAATNAACLVQHPNDCVVGSMPQAALATSSRVAAVPLAQLPGRIRDEIRRR